MKKVDYTEVKTIYKDAIASVSEAEGVDIGVAIDMLIKVAIDPDALPIRGIPENFDFDKFVEDVRAAGKDI